MLLILYIIYFIYSLFFGCMHVEFYNVPINILSIRDVSTAANYQEIVQGVTAFDNITSGYSVKNIPSSTISKVTQLLCNENKSKFIPFMQQTFKVLLDNKRQISLSLPNIYNNIKDAKFLCTMFGGTGVKQFQCESECDEDKKNEFNYFIPSDNTNIPIIVLNKFNNVKNINIYAQDYNYYCPLSLFSLLSLLDKRSRTIQIKVHGHRSKIYKTSWISFVWNRDCFALKQEYERKGYIIEFKEGWIEVSAGGSRSCPDWISIIKK